jgi:hypothetical protein
VHWGVEAGVIAVVLRRGHAGGSFRRNRHQHSMQDLYYRCALG